MGILSKVICETKLPIPWEDFSDKENEIFSKVKWDEIDFYTSSFFDYEESALGLNIVSSYTISEDRQFYKSLKEYKFIENKSGEMIPQEQDAGIERQDFTGEILFWKEIMEEKNDYEVSFVALFFKGELKELNLDGWKKRSNKERKAAEKKLKEEIIEERNERESLWSKIKYPFKRLALIFSSLIKWIIFKILDILIRIEVWIVK